VALLAAVLLLTVAAGAGAAPFVPDDPYYAPYQWYGDTLALPEAWAVSRGSPAVVIAVLDSGVMADTPDLAGRVLPPLSSTGEILDGTDHHHGTWVATSVAMGVNNGLGGAGVGNFSILPVTVTDERGVNGSYNVAQGIRLAADAGARVINISLSTLNYGYLDEAAAYARTRGALTFVAAGNANRREVMTDYENLIFVAGTDRTDARWDDGVLGSTWGPHVDLSAPAVDILIADPHNASLPGGYGIIKGTSFSCSLTSGAAAMAWAVHPGLAPDEVRGLLYATAVDLGDAGWDEVFGHGRVDIGAVAAAAYALTPEPATLALLALGAAAVVLRRRRT
jgi:hypothetical protein